MGQSHKISVQDRRAIKTLRRATKGAPKAEQRAFLNAAKYQQVGAGRLIER